MSQQNGHAPHTPPLPFEDETELKLYQLQTKLHRLAVELRLKSPSSDMDMKETLRPLHRRDPEGTRMIVDHLRLAASALDKACKLMQPRIDWQQVELFFYPPEGGFIESPGAHLAVAFAAAQRSGRNGFGLEAEHSNGHHQNGTIPSNGHHNGHAAVVVTAAAPATPEPARAEAPLPEPIKAPRREPTQAQLASYGRSLRSACEREKRRFYSMAKERGLPTDKSAEKAMKQALSEYLGEEITSRTQMDEHRWSKAASAVYTEDLTWSAPAPRLPKRPRALQPSL